MSQLGLNNSAACGLGGAGIIGQLYSNFGFYFIYLYILGYWFGFLFKLFQKGDKFGSIVYLSSLPFLAVHFYNQNIYVFLKILLFNIALMPFVLTLSIEFFKSMLFKRYLK